MNIKSIAIDGPSASGKSTVAKRVASILGFTYIDTGAMYRAITLKALQLNIDLNDETQYSFLSNTKLEFVNSLMHLDGKDVSKEIREQDVVLNVSLVSSLKVVREALVKMQRDMASKVSSVMDGRDIGTNVLKDADLKIYLIAREEVRALRRYKEQKEKGSLMSYEDVLADLKRRDEYDSNRLINPLRKADDAILVDSSDYSIEDTTNIIINLFKENCYE